MCLVYVTEQTSFSTGLIPVCCDIKLKESSLFLNSFTQNNGQTADAAHTAATTRKLYNIHAGVAQVA